MPNPTFLKISCPKLTEVVDRLKKFNGEAPKAIARGMRGWAEETRTAAIQVTPKDTGNLRNSIYVKQDGTKTEIGAGGPAAPYAVAVHEMVGRSLLNPWAGIRWTTPGTGPKYIENPVVERMPKLGEAIGGELNKEIAKVGQ